MAHDNLYLTKVQFNWKFILIMYINGPRWTYLDKLWQVQKKLLLLFGHVHIAADRGCQFCIWILNTVTFTQNTETQSTQSILYTALEIDYHVYHGWWITADLKYWNEILWNSVWCSSELLTLIWRSVFTHSSLTFSLCISFVRKDLSSVLSSS